MRSASVSDVIALSMVSNHCKESRELWNEGSEEKQMRRELKIKDGSEGDDGN